jgi:hypothetical protein
VHQLPLAHAKLPFPFPVQFKCEMGAGHFRCGILHAIQAMQTVCSNSQSACHNRGDVCCAVNPDDSID